MAAHLPNDNLQATAHWFNTGMQYQQFHALALMVVGLLFARRPSRWFVVAGWLMIVGTVLFSGNLYLRSLAGFHDLHAVTPWGGGAFLAGWMAVAIGVVSRR